MVGDSPIGVEVICGHADDDKTANQRADYEADDKNAESEENLILVRGEELENHRVVLAGNPRGRQRSAGGDGGKGCRQIVGRG